MLYSDSQLAKDVYGLAELLQKNSKKRRLGFSIEGKVLERDPLDESKITKARLTGLAITHIPKNPATICEIMKGERDGFDMEWEDGKLKWAKIFSALGGNVKIRTNEQVFYSDETEDATGENSNPLLQWVNPGEPTIHNLKAITVWQGKKPFYRTINTKPGGNYQLFAEK